MTVRGSCLCQGVKFEITGWITPIQACHAARCRKATGAAFSPEMVAGVDGFSWLDGENLIRRYEAPILREPPAYSRAFCKTCGSPLPVEMAGTGMVILQAGVLDGDLQTHVFRHAFVAQKACWHELLDAKPRYDMQPPPPSPRELGISG